MSTKNIKPRVAPFDIKPRVARPIKPRVARFLEFILEVLISEWSLRSELREVTDRTVTFIFKGKEPA